MRLGLISDTHDFLDPRVQNIFKGVDHILHAGDIGTVWITFQLAQVAPVIAVLGNTDADLSFNQTEVTTLGGEKFLVHHIVNPVMPDETLRRRLAKERPDFVIFGHTHKAFDQTLNGTRFINPGYAGRPKFNQPRSVAILHLDDTGATLEFVPLPG